jgi:hypothetical protein
LPERAFRRCAEDLQIVAVTVWVRVMQEHKQALGNIKARVVQAGTRKGIPTAGDPAHPS